MSGDEILGYSKQRILDELLENDFRPASRIHSAGAADVSSTISVADRSSLLEGAIMTLKSEGWNWVSDSKSHATARPGHYLGKWSDSETKCSRPRESVGAVEGGSRNSEC